MTSKISQSYFWSLQDFDDDDDDDFQDVWNHEKKKSWVWQHFLYHPRRSVAKCKLCLTNVSTSGCGSTSGLSRHLKSKHQIVSKPIWRINEYYLVTKIFRFSRQKLKNGEISSKNRRKFEYSRKTHRSIITKIMIENIIINFEFSR